jgi:hypothetical protein
MSVASKQPARVMQPERIITISFKIMAFLAFEGKTRQTPTKKKNDCRESELLLHHEVIMR